MSAATTDVRDRISAYLAERGGFGQMGESVFTEGAVTWHCVGVSPAVWVVLSPRRGGIAGVSVDGAPPEDDLIVPADAPDLLARLGETLDRLGV